MQVVRNHNFCGLDASVPSGSRRDTVGIEPTGALTPFHRDFSQTTPSAYFFATIWPTGSGLYPWLPKKPHLH
jgi:hypothetical protein